MIVRIVDVEEEGDVLFQDDEEFQLSVNDDGELFVEMCHREKMAGMKDEQVFETLKRFGYNKPRNQKLSRARYR